MPQRAQPPHARPARGAVRDPAPAVWRRAFTNTGAGAPDPAAPRQSPGGPAGRPRPGSVCAARPQRTDSHTPARAARGEIGPAPPPPGSPLRARRTWRCSSPAPHAAPHTDLPGPAPFHGLGHRLLSTRNPAPLASGPGPAWAATSLPTVAAGPERGLWVPAGRDRTGVDRQILLSAARDGKRRERPRAGGTRRGGRSRAAGRELGFLQQHRSAAFSCTRLFTVATDSACLDLC